MLFIGLMSGTSVDAIDAALVQIDRKPAPQGGGYRARVLGHIEHAWPDALRQELLSIMAPATVGMMEICEDNVAVARELARAVEELLKKTSIAAGKITAIGSHGQTVCHAPRRPGDHRRDTILGGGSTLQLGDVSVLATLTGITTVGNFRAADMAAGGQGAPLVPWTDQALLADPTLTRCVQNIGGIANVTYLPGGPLSGVTGQRRERRGRAKTPGRARLDPRRSSVIAFDTGPGNMLMDAVVSIGTRGKERFDKNGRLAAAGKLHQGIFRELQAHPYFSLKPPKSTGREAFGEHLARSIWHEYRNHKLPNVVHTLARLTAWSIADAYVHFLPELPDEVILCGGGADNPVLIKMLQEEFGTLTSTYTRPKPPVIRRIDEFGIPNKAKEATSFALLAAATLDGIPANLPAVTGASRPVVLGVVATPAGRRANP